ncbi:MAG: hypothetical protein GXY83_25185 [Rhodopirellula sp.]|nr:hypothetical protein [Rhodopirellula sp.]
MAESDHNQPTKTALREPLRQALSADRAATSRPAVEDLQRAARELQSQNEELRREQDELRLLNEAMERTVIERTELAEWRTDQLRTLLAELAQAEQRERRRLAQLLHDELQQCLVAAQFKLAAIQHRTEDMNLREDLRQALGLINESIDASRTLTCELSPPVLHEGGLCAALESLAQRNQDTHGLQTDIRAENGVEPTDEGMRMLLFQFIRELLFNVVKHANTDLAWIELSRPQPGWIEVAVRDAGDGFDPVTLDHAAPGKNSFGLFSVRERLKIMGGRLTIESSRGRGTRVTIAVPASR